MATIYSRSAHKHSKDNFLRDLWRHGHKYPTEILATFPLKMTNRRSSPFWNAFIRYFRNIFFLLLSFSLWCLFFRVSQKSSSPWLVMDDGNLLNFVYNARVRYRLSFSRDVWDVFWIVKVKYTKKYFRFLILWSKSCFLKKWYFQSSPPQ